MIPKFKNTHSIAAELARYDMRFCATVYISELTVPDLRTHDHYTVGLVLVVADTWNNALGNGRVWHEVGIPTDGGKRCVQMLNLLFLPFICPIFFHISIWATSKHFMFLKSWVFILSISMRVYYIECVFGKCHVSKWCAHWRVQMRFGSIVTRAGMTPPWQTAVFAADRLLPIIVFICFRISIPSAF